MPRLVQSAQAGLVAAGLLALSIAPASAATVAQADATALVLSIGGTPTDSGTYRVVNNGNRETATGNNQPLITAVDNQDFIAAGTLAQDASTDIRNGNGFSAACAGLAGDSATLAAVEDGNNCLTPGDNLSLNAGTVDLTDIELVRTEILMGLPQQIQDALSPLLDPILAGLSDGLETALDAAGGALTLDLGAIQSQCTASPTSAEADSQITDVSLDGSLGGTDVTLVELPVNPGPNTKVLTDLDEVLTAVVDGLRAQLTQGLDGALSPLEEAIVDPLQEQLIDNVIGQIAPQLAPLEDNVLDITLNKQVRSANGRAIEVTALDARVLPAAQEFVGFDFANIEIGRASCGPNGRVGPPTEPPNPTDPPTPGNPGNPGDPGNPQVPTSVPAGAAGDSSLNDLVAFGALGGLGALAAAAGVASYRRLRFEL